MKKLAALLALALAVTVSAQSYKQNDTYVLNMAPQTMWTIQDAGAAATVTRFIGMKNPSSVADEDTTWSKVYWLAPSISFHAVISNAHDSSHYQVEMWTGNTTTSLAKIGTLSWTNQSGYRASQATMDSIGVWWAVSDVLYPPGHRYCRFLVRTVAGHHRSTNTDYIEITALGRTE